MCPRPQSLRHASLQRPTVSGTHSICSGIAICVGLSQLSRSAFFRTLPDTNGLGWPRGLTVLSNHGPTTPGPPEWPEFFSRSGRDGLHVDANAHTHGRRHGHFAQINTLAGSRLGLGQRVEQGHQVALELVGFERTATDRAVHDAGLVDAE